MHVEVALTGFMRMLHVYNFYSHTSEEMVMASCPACNRLYMTSTDVLSVAMLVLSVLLLSAYLQQRALRTIRLVFLSWNKLE